MYVKPACDTFEFTYPSKHLLQLPFVYSDYVITPESDRISIVTAENSNNYFLENKHISVDFFFGSVY